MNTILRVCPFLIAFDHAALAAGISGKLLHTFNDPTVTSRDQFGFSVAVDGNHILIGAIGDDTNGSFVGQAHLFDAMSGSLLHTFDDPTVTSRDQFGFSVAMDRNHVLIGAAGDSTEGVRVGQAHLFDATTGNLLHTFNDPTVTASGNFGSSVALDGHNVLIGAAGDSTKGDRVGQAHLFDATTGDLLHTLNDPTVTSEDLFGGVALDGNQILIGANGDDTNGSSVGQAHLFDTTTRNLRHTFNDPTVTGHDHFGISVAVDGNRVLIGAIGDNTNGTGVGQAHLYDTTTGNLLHTFNDPTVTGHDQFGWSVALDGNHVLVGAVGDDTNGSGVGQAHLFDATTGNLLYTFNDPTVTGSDGFGWSVALDGNHVLIGAVGDRTNGDTVGQAYLFEVVVPESCTVTLLTQMALIAGGSRRRMT